MSDDPAVAAVARAREGGEVFGFIGGISVTPRDLPPSQREVTYPPGGENERRRLGYVTVDGGQRSAVLSRFMRYK